jgi:hypothetical protein
MLNLHAPSLPRPNRCQCVAWRMTFQTEGVETAASVLKSKCEDTVLPLVFYAAVDLCTFIWCQTASGVTPRDMPSLCDVLASSVKVMEGFPTMTTMTAQLTILLNQVKVQTQSLLVLPVSNNSSAGVRPAVPPAPSKKGTKATIPSAREFLWLPLLCSSWSTFL